VPIGEWFESLRVGIGLVPPALIAIILLAGPTAGWLLYRYVVQPRAARSRGYDGARFWVCPSCRSVNDFRLQRCYRCDAQPADEDLEVIDAQPSGPRRLTPVGPGLDLGGPRPMPRPRPVSSLEMPSAGWETNTSAWVTEPDDEEEWDEEFEEDRAALPDIAAMTEVIEAPGRRRVARPPTSIPVGPGRPAIARPRRVAVAGQTAEPDDDPPAA
jgi:hypothetical protein